MFSFLKKPPAVSEAIQLCTTVAQQASLDIAYRDGVPTFIVGLNQTLQNLKPYFQHREAVREFILIIENRVVEELPSDPNEDLGLPAELLGDRSGEFEAAKRVVATSDSKGLFQWRWNKDSEISIGPIAS